MKIYTYAALKDHFQKEFSINEPLENIAALSRHLGQQQPGAAGILASCRFAVSDNFVNGDFELQPDTQVHIIPPSSGG